MRRSQSRRSDDLSLQGSRGPTITEAKNQPYQLHKPVPPPPDCSRASKLQLIPREVSYECGTMAAHFPPPPFPKTGCEARTRLAQFPHPSHPKTGDETVSSHGNKHCSRSINQLSKRLGSVGSSADMTHGNNR